jgi:hypothetical protein
MELIKQSEWDREPKAHQASLGSLRQSCAAETLARAPGLQETWEES